MADVTSTLGAGGVGNGPSANGTNTSSFISSSDVTGIGHNLQQNSNNNNNLNINQNLNIKSDYGLTTL
jgi:hypothetical protein